VAEAVLTPKNIDVVLARGMGPSLHWFPEDTSAIRLATVMVGMANASGGTVLLGVAPRSGNIQGVKDYQETLDRLFQAALLSDPPLVLPMPRQVQSSQGLVVSISIPPGLPHVYSLEGRYLGRQGTQSTPLTARQLRALLMARGVVQFESQIPPGVQLSDLDVSKVKAYLAALDLPREGGQDDWDSILLRRGCLKPAPDQGAGAFLPTYAGLLLFGRYPQQWLPNATLLAVRFASATFGDQFMKQEIAGTLPEQLRQAEAFVRTNMRSVVRLVGLAHQETTEYPMEAVRELLVNAVAHRDYNLGGDTIHLNIFSDRVEVHSPGALPGPVNLENLLEARFSRNAVIAQVLSDMGFIERLGYGLDRVVRLMRQQGLRPPRFEEIGGSFKVTLWGEPFNAQAPVDLSAYQKLDLNPRQQMALNFTGKHQRITNRDYQELCPDVHPETLRRDLADLVQRRVFIKVGDKKATYYILK
jgi:ATP-dependent DNA helicase RecG